jgi:hypothetical protein
LLDRLSRLEADRSAVADKWRELERERARLIRQWLPGVAVSEVAANRTRITALRFLPPRSGGMGQ